VASVVDRLRLVPVDRLAELVAAAAYGTVLVLAALGTISITQVSMGHGVELVAGVGAATWVAHLFAELLARHVSRQRPLDRGEVHEAVVDGSPILASTVLPAGALLLGRLDVIADGTARAVAIAAALAQLLAIGVVIGQIAPARRSALWIFGTLTLVLGLSVVAVTVWLGH
jgi:hypothetical protein